MRSRTQGWVMPAEDILSMLQMIEAKITSSEFEVHHRDALVRLKHILEDDLKPAMTTRMPLGGEHQQAE